MKRIIQYINGVADYGIWYSRDKNVDLASYSNADWFWNVDHRWCTSCDCFYVGTNLVAWMSKKQRFNILVHCWSGIYCYWATGSYSTQLFNLDEIVVRFWDCPSPWHHDSALWQHKCYQHFQKSCQTLSDKAHWYSLSLHPWSSWDANLLSWILFILNTKSSLNHTEYQLNITLSHCLESWHISSATNGYWGIKSVIALDISLWRNPRVPPAPSVESIPNLVAQSFVDDLCAFEDTMSIFIKFPILTYRLFCISSHSPHQLGNQSRFMGILKFPEAQPQ